MASRRNVQYTQIPGDEDGDGFVGGGGRRTWDPRFDYMPRSLDRIPWKSIALAVFLLLLGCLLLFLAFFIVTGHMEGENSQAYALLVLGILTFLPANGAPRIVNQMVHASLESGTDRVAYAVAYDNWRTAFGQKHDFSILSFKLVNPLWISDDHRFWWLKIPGNVSSVVFVGRNLMQAVNLRVLSYGLAAVFISFYETRIAYYSWRGAEGYRFAAIPDY